MSKRLTHELLYDATVDEVSAMLADPAFRERVCDDQGVLRHDIAIESQGEGMNVVVDQVQETKGLPSVAKKVVGNETNIVQSEQWSSSTQGTVQVTIPGKPGEMKGTITLESRGEQTVETVDMDIKVSIPMVGGKLEGVIKDLLLAALKSENKTGKAYLAG